MSSDGNLAPFNPLDLATSSTDVRPNHFQQISGFILGHKLPVPERKIGIVGKGKREREAALAA